MFLSISGVIMIRSYKSFEDPFDTHKETLITFFKTTIPCEPKDSLNLFVCNSFI